MKDVLRIARRAIDRRGRRGRPPERNAGELRRLERLVHELFEVLLPYIPTGDTDVRRRLRETLRLVTGAQNAASA